MRDTYEIGSTPNAEDCAQVGSSNYQAQAMKECRAYKNQLERMFPDMPAGMRLKIQTNYHDFGAYHEVAVVYNDDRDDHNDYLWGNLELGAENWDDEAKKELGIGVASATVGEYRSPKQMGISMFDLEDAVFNSIVPACCSEGCQVEPDGHCSHGHPSVLIAMGLI
jgi:hypothetical protein